MFGDILIEKAMLYQLASYLAVNVWKYHVKYTHFTLQYMIQWCVNVFDGIGRIWWYWSYLLRLCVASIKSSMISRSFL